MGGLLAVFVFCAVPARANLVSNGSFTGCNGSLVGGCSASNFAIGTSSSGTVYNLTNWSLTNLNNLKCIAVQTGGTYTNNFLCGSGWTGGTTNLQMYVLPGASPNGGNYLMSDGDPLYSGTLYQTIAGLTIGKQYTLSFYQTAGQQKGNVGNSTDYWKVTMSSGAASAGTIYNTFGSTAQNGIAVTSASLTAIPWQQISYTFTASATSEVLNFLAVGQSGVPPYLFLDGVNLDLATPEPGTLSLLLVGLLAIPLARKHLSKRG